MLSCPQTSTRVPWWKEASKMLERETMSPWSFTAHKWRRCPSRHTQRTSQRATPSLHQYVPLQWHLRIHHFVSDYSIFRHVKYHQDEFSLACPLGKRHVFPSGAKDMHRSWLRTMTEGGLGAIRSKLIQRNQCQTRLYAPPFWHRQVRTALQVARSFILISLFKANGRNAWYWARFSLPTEDRRITFTDELNWISTPPAHGRSGIHRGCGAGEHYLSISDCVRQSEKTFQPWFSRSSACNDSCKGSLQAKPYLPIFLWLIVGSNE